MATPPETPRSTAGSSVGTKRDVSDGEKDVKFSRRRRLDVVYPFHGDKIRS
ncbi:hypothetical protein E4U40_000278 [Claviceps sp. LM458 group G5]|nr:hypothetical protein E4U40_000278 [Claviceps sp. LM458 group G5]